MRERTKKILNWIREQNQTELCIRQATLGYLFSCSKRTIGRALRELIEANLITDLNKRGDKRCKIYQIDFLSKKEEAKELISEHGEDWGKCFAHLDGTDGKPTWQACVEEAVQDTSRDPKTNLRIYVECCLVRHAEKHWVPPTKTREQLDQEKLAEIMKQCKVGEVHTAYKLWMAYKRSCNETFNRSA